MTKMIVDNALLQILEDGGIVADRNNVKTVTLHISTGHVVTAVVEQYVPSGVTEKIIRMLRVVEGAEVQVVADPPRGGVRQAALATQRWD